MVIEDTVLGYSKNILEIVTYPLLLWRALVAFWRFEMPELPMPFDKWVNDNNPSSETQYSKGWWDYVEVLRRLEWKYGIHLMEVTATYVMRTPPPAESLLMPVVRFGNEVAEIWVMYNFGKYPQEWTISIKRGESRVEDLHGLFDACSNHIRRFSR